MNLKQIPLKLIFLTLLSGIVLLVSCRKEKNELINELIIKEPCVLQTDNPSGRSYTSDSIVAFNCTSKYCGILPLSSKNYWIYEDSVYKEGVFKSVKYDTLQYLTTRKSLSDGLVWWESNISIGLPEILYANDSSVFGLNNRFFTLDIKDVKKEFGYFSGDSIRYLTNFDDAAAMGRSLKLNSTVTTKAGEFNNCLYFEKNAFNYRRDQVIIKPGLGVIKYISEKATPGSRVMNLQNISTLIKVYID